jgi:hypothetical protein
VVWLPNFDVTTRSAPIIYYLPTGYIALIAPLAMFDYFVFRNGDSKMDGKGAKIQQPNTEGIMRVEFASYCCSFSTLCSLVSTTISSNAIHIGSKRVSPFNNFHT